MFPGYPNMETYHVMVLYMGIEVVFQFFFLDHKMFEHHRALVDTRKLRLMVLKLLEHVKA